MNFTHIRLLINDFTHFMKIRKVEKNLQMKIKRYVEYMHEENISGYNRGETILNSLPFRLKNELLENIYMKWINDIPILQHFSKPFLIKLSQKFEEKTYSPEDIIYEVIYIKFL